MLLSKTNIENKLSRYREQGVQNQNMLQEVQDILDNGTAQKKEITTTLNAGRSTPHNPFDFELLETDRIYHINDIRAICIDYRLRFLDTKYFKGKIPQLAIDKIANMERAHNTQIKGFKIMAPSKLFKLADKDDPLLFAPIGNGYFYLIHKWGNDLHPLRKLLVWPFKNIVNLIMTTLVVSFVATLLVPNGLFSKSNSSTEFWIIFFFMFKSIAAVVIFYGFALGKNFNPAIWNSKYFNA